MKEPTSLASWTRALRKQLDALGLDSIALCQQAGLDPNLMDDPNARYPLSGTTRLWALAVQASGDPAIGLRVSRFVSPTTFHALGYALVASGSLREVFEQYPELDELYPDKQFDDAAWLCQRWLEILPMPIYEKQMLIAKQNSEAARQFLRRLIAQ